MDTMRNNELAKKDQLQKRMEMKRRIDEAMIAGTLTLDNLLAIPPTATSSEHHQTVMRELKNREGVGAANAIASLALENLDEEALYEVAA